MENHPHPGLSVRYDCIEPAGLTIAEAAAHLQVDERELDEVCHGRAPISAEMAVRIDLAFGGDAETWARLQAVYEVSQVRKRADEFQIMRLWPPERSTVAAD